jgi:hypothetical protein
MNPYLNGIMALSQLTPEQFDTGMQRFQQIQGMQPQGLSALQARQSGLTANMAGGQSQIGQLSPDVLQKSQERQQRIANAVPAGFIANNVLNPPVPGQSIGQAIPTAQGYTNPQTGEQVFISTRGDNVGEITRRIAAPEGYQPRSSQPTMSPFSNTQGSFGTGAMPYTQPYYQRSFNPYAGGYGMGFGGGMPSYGGFGGGMPSYGGFGGGQQMYGGFGGGKGGGRPSYGGGKGGRGY